METKVINTRQQEFDSQVYWKCGFYFQRYGKRLHRIVWEYHNGEIPEGYDIHHIDFDCTNNQIENLICIPNLEHQRIHTKRNLELGIIGEFSPQCRDAANKWHGSGEGRNWHKEHYEQMKEALHKKIDRECKVCGKSHQTNKIRGNTFCSNNCKSAFRRASGVDNIIRICLKCGKEFIVNKYSLKKYCSDKHI